MKKTIALAAGLFVAGCLAPQVAGCSASQKAAEADATYATEHLRCVDRFESKAEIDACRAAVRMRWGIAEKIADAGSDR